MRILHITPEAPGRSSGGKIGIKQTALSLIQNGHIVDYVGPELIDKEICALYNSLYILEPSNNLFLRFYDTFHMNTNRRYRSWMKLELDYSVYDVFVMDFTKLNYVLKKIPNNRLIVRVHNVEADYSFYNYQYRKNPINFLDRVFAKKREKEIVYRARSLIVLTEKDKMRLCELYGVPAYKMEVVPVCIPEPEVLEREDDSKRVKMILNGSLWFGPNYEGIKWFLEEVYKRLDIPKSLIIAGANPNTELVELVKHLQDVTLISSPESMAPYFQQANIAIAPVFDGAGMKVKVAEALSFGLPVVGTSHAFEGYDITDGLNSYRADDVEQFIRSIRKYYELNEESRAILRRNSYELFRRNYSQSYSDQAFQQILLRLKS